MLTVETARVPRWYHPVPFPGFESLMPNRPDSKERYDVIIKNAGDKNKSILDIGCANGYFLFKFTQDFKGNGIGIESDIDFRNFVRDMAKEKNLNIRVYPELTIKEYFDIGLFLDIYDFQTTEKFGFIQYLSKYCKNSFVSTCTEENAMMEKRLKDNFESVLPIYTGLANRIIFYCRGERK